MKTVIFIGGPTASGKSTFTKKLNDNIPNSITYRRYQGFFDIANQKGIRNEDIFKKVTSEEVDDWFVNLCKIKDVVISDVHYAVQMDRKTNYPDINQEYVPTVSKELIHKLQKEDIQIVAIFLACSPQTCLTRSILRNNETKKEIRNVSIEDAINEYNAEEKEWKNIAYMDSIKDLKLNSEILTSEELVRETLEFLNKKDNKVKKRCYNQNKVVQK